jgi:hypothetical protein
MRPTTDFIKPEETAGVVCSLVAVVSAAPSMNRFPWVSEGAKNVLNPSVNLNGI